MASWLDGQGFPRVSVLLGGLGGWRQSGYPVDRLLDATPIDPADAGPDFDGADFQAQFLPSLVERYRREGALPARRRLATLFVDIAGSTRLLAEHPPEVVLGVVQRFMRIVTEVALAYCGDVKDFEGDGALLYFESTAEAVQAALAIRAALARTAEGGDRATPARMSLGVGELVVGVVGTALRRAIELVGPSLSVGSRLLKQIPAGAIITTGEVVESLRAAAPELAAGFALRDPSFEVPDSGGIRVATYVNG